MARSIIQTKCIIADDFTEIETKTQQLLDRYNISDIQLHSFDIEAFGGQKFLITIFFKDSYANFALIKFVSVLLPIVFTKGDLEPATGLTCSVETVEGP